MPTELEQAALEYYGARAAIRQVIRDCDGKGLNIQPELVRRLRAAEEGLMTLCEKISTDTQILRTEA